MKPHARSRRPTNVNVNVTVRAALMVTLIAAFGTLPLDAQQDENDAVLSLGDDLVFGSEVNVVTVPVTVTDRKGIYVNGLEAFDFRIYDNRKPQVIDSFEVAFLPISMVICVQSSDRVEGILPEVTKTAILFTDMVLGEFGQAALIAFDQRVRLMQDFTNDEKKIEKALKDITLGSDAVRLSDAVYEGIRMLVKRPSTHRKVIVVISESQETASEVGLGETMRTAQIQDIMIYPVRLSTIKGWFKRDDKPIPPSIPPGVQARASIPGAAETPTTQMQHRVRATPNVIPIVIDLVRGVKNLLFNNPLELLAVGTGGRVYSPMTEDGIQKAIMGIGEDLRSQYLLSYRPNNLNDSGIFHRIEVEVFYDRAKVRARPGYWQGPAPVPSGEPVEPIAVR
ncbi:MAG: VWA domain-containing protein [Bryobacterales bacterium]|nr:VWA domain-containing protein [Bryobacterales bacterium]